MSHEDILSAIDAIRQVLLDVDAFMTHEQQAAVAAKLVELIAMLNA